MNIPAEYLTDPAMCSRNILGEYQLKHLDIAAKLRKQIEKLEAEYHDHMVAAGLALYLRENREAMLDILARAATDTEEVA